MKTTLLIVMILACGALAKNHGGVACAKLFCNTTHTLTQCYSCVQDNCYPGDEKVSEAQEWCDGRRYPCQEK